MIHDERNSACNGLNINLGTPVSYARRKEYEEQISLYENHLEQRLCLILQVRAYKEFVPPRAPGATAELIPRLLSVNGR